MSNGRRLSGEEAQLWRRVIATVEPLQKGRAATHDPAPVSRALNPPKIALPKIADKDAMTAAMFAANSAAQPPAKVGPAWTYTAAKPAEQSGGLDGQWDGRLGRGQVQPDATVDLHGHSLASAHQQLDQALGRAITGGLRLVLLITGKPRAPGSGRGAIRAAVADWLSASRHSSQIAAVRRAHPRHGGDGALYIVLRRKR